MMADVNGSTFSPTEREHSQALPATNIDYTAQQPQSNSTPTGSAVPSTIKTEPAKHALVTSSDLSNGHLAHILSESQPMSVTTSGSSLSSVMEEDASGLTPYGTRSRHRSGTRPNYSEDIDMDFDIPAVKPEFASSKRSTPSEHSTSFHAINSIEVGTAQSYPNHAHVPNGHTENSDGHVSEKKKRKYERANVAKVAPEARNMAKDLIPGTSHFFAANSRTPEPPPTKRRKTGDGRALNTSGPATGSSSAVGLTSRKPTTPHVTRNGSRQNCLVTFHNSGYLLSNGKMVDDDGTVYGVDDCVYLICEPPGEPYYLARIMEFRQADAHDPQSPVTSFLVNWFYRPKDIQRYSTDQRYLYASMQSDESPITSLRGKCVIKHRTEILDLEDFRKQRDTFWFTQLYDRYIQRPYEMIPSASVVNVPDKVKKTINDKWKFLVVEPARMKELTSAVKLCKRCGGYCAPNDSVDCGVCRNTYHMTCVRPPLLKKPSRGFAWSCGPCSRAQEKKLEQRHTALLPEPTAERDDEGLEEEEEEAGTIDEKPEIEMHNPGESTSETVPSVQMDIARANLWPWRYLGIHCRVEDVLQYDDRAIYPRAISRLGPKYQATVPIWHGHPVTLVKPIDIRRKYAKGAGNKKDAKLSKETVAALEVEKQDRAKRPKWIQDEPLGYVARGEDYPVSDERSTVQPLFIMPPDMQATPLASTATNGSLNSNEKLVDDYMSQALTLARDNNLDRDVYPGFKAKHAISRYGSRTIMPTNYLDKALQVLAKHTFNVEEALNELRKSHSAEDIGDPCLTKEEMKRFEDGVAKHGSELRLVRKHVKTRPHGEIVRTYYSWKKSEKGQEIWSQHSERRHSRKRAEVSWTDIADEEDDSAFDNDKSVARKRRFQCKFCLTRSSRQWRRAPNVAPGAVVLDDPKGSSKDKANQLVVALCQRCAFLWRKYAMRWEDPDEVAKSLSQSGGRAWKRKSDEDVLREIVYANEAAGFPTSATVAAAAVSIGVPVTILQAQESSKKKLKISQEKEMTPGTTDADGQTKKKEKTQPPPPPPPPPPRPPTPPIEPQPPKWRQLPCAVCREVEIANDQLLSCKHCKLTVHRRCYAIPEPSNPNRWVCDTCLNDRQNEMSLDYKCVLCPVNDRKPELIEPPKVTHKKKNDRDREKEKLEKKLADDMAARYQRQQVESGRPPWPREAVKRTVNNNWMHLVCAIWTPEIRFSDADKCDDAEGIGAVLTAPSRADAVCKLCKIIDGGCISCQQCHDTFHVACAHEAGYIFGFDITPVKGSRKELVQVVSLGGETGSMTAAVWCKEHINSMKTILHGIHEVDRETNLNALQLFVRKFKQADRALTGTARKASVLSGLAKGASILTSIPTLASRRTSLLVNGNINSREPPLTPPADDVDGATSSKEELEKHRCVTCNTDVSPQWQQLQPLNGDAQHSFMTKSTQSNGLVSVTIWQCHRCHMQGRSNGNSEDELDEKIDAAADPHQPDYFELTAPRPLPPQLLGSWTTNHCQPTMHFYSSGDMAHVEQAQTELRATKVTVTDQSGRSHTVSGRTFGSIQDLRLIAWKFFVHNIQDPLGYSEAKHALVTEEGHKVYDTDTLMRALAGILYKGNREVSWKIVDHVHEAVNNPNRPPSAHSMQQAPSLVSVPRPNTIHPRPTSFSAPAARPSPGGTSGGLPQLQGGQIFQAGSPLPDIASTTSSRSSPYFSISPAARAAIPATFATGSVSPPRVAINMRRSTTPRERGGPPNGASSSPNLKNLVH